jgi:predicted metal-dependent phosphoesterase TrpH
VSKVDLHIHSTASDGKFSPAEIVKKSAELGLTVIAITDHDTVDGVLPALEAAKAFPQLRVIPGVEISTYVATGEVHVLGYFIDYTNQELCSTLSRMRNSRRERARQMVAKLKNLGLQVDWSRVTELAGSGSIGRPHIAQAMLEKGYIKSFKEAFTRYIGLGGPAYVEREKISPAEAVELILRADGLPVLAHPLTIDDPEAMVMELKNSGLVGIEVYYHDCTDEEINRLTKLADRYSLIMTGGSDFHGLDTVSETMIGGAGVPMESAEQLIVLAEERISRSVR